MKDRKMNPLLKSHGMQLYKLTEVTEVTLHTYLPRVYAYELLYPCPLENHINHSSCNDLLNSDVIKLYNINTTPQL